MIDSCGTVHEVAVVKIPSRVCVRHSFGPSQPDDAGMGTRPGLQYSTLSDIILFDKLYDHFFVS